MYTFAFLSVLLWQTNSAHVPREVVLLDTTEEPTLEWTKYPFGPQAATPGWVEESFTVFDKGINWRSYVVCDVPYSNVNNWLWTPFIERGQANRIYIEIKFSMRDCSLFPGTALSCKETFSLLYYEFDAATREPPPWEPESYKLIDRIAADEGRFTSTEEVIINKEVRSIPVTKKGVYFAFRDQGACLSLLAIRVYYLNCPEVTENFAVFPSVPTGSEITSIEQTLGRCVINSVPYDTPKYLCKGDGRWNLLTGGCHCKKGFESNLHNQTCTVCPSGKHKPEDSNVLCELCPKHSNAPLPGLTVCRCDSGWFRATTDPSTMECTQPPTAPRNLTVNFVDQSTVILTWNPPAYLGGRSDTSYRVKCENCPIGVGFIQSHERFGRVKDTRITISGLSPVTTYRLQVIAENGVSDQSGERPYSEIVVTTEASGLSTSRCRQTLPISSEVSSVVSNVRVYDVKSSEVTLAWSAPVDSFYDIETYEVRYFVSGTEENASTISTSKEEIVVDSLQEKTEYGFQVRAKATNGWGEFSAPVYGTTGQVLNDSSNVQVRVIAGATISAFVILGVICVMVILLVRRGSDDCSKKQPSDCDALEYRNGEVPSTFPFVGLRRSYIDPHTYEDPNQAIREFASEIDSSFITIEAIIGGGEFGDVCRGKLKYPGRAEFTVALKTLKPGSSEKAKIDFLTEASIMGQFKHPNVIFLEGVVTKSSPSMIITEYMENGSLDTFLRANDGKFQISQLITMLRGIASGMQYLSEMSYVHRDLAARNVLVNAQLVSKIADFGLSREIESTTEGAYTTRGGKIPVRWTAPEAIAYRKFTSASDVWSFGIVSWEVISYGERPYWNWSNQEVIKSIEKGYRLPPPMDCPEAIHQLMLDCWQKERTHRPTFASIVKTLDRLLQCNETLRKVPQSGNHNPLISSGPNWTRFTTIEEWLASINMSRYLKNFECGGITSLEVASRLSVQDLKGIGITLLGHQKKVMNSVQAMRAQISEGFLV